MRILRWLLPLCAALAGCNLAVSDHPMFSAGEQLATPLKSGLWVADDPDCVFDSTKPRQTWPKCAVWLVLRDNRVAEISGDEKTERPVAILIADGSPPIAQIEVREKESDIVYVFYAIEPAAHDSRRRITALSVWGVRCGTEKTPGSSQVDPYPGFDKECHPASKDAVRAAAAASRAAATDIGRMKWVRASAD